MTKLFRRILVPHDFSRHATRALGVAADLAVAHGSRLVVLHALPPSYPVVDLPNAPLSASLLRPPSAAVVSRVRQRLAAVVTREIAGRGNPRVECRVVVADPFQAIMQAARGATAIVMGTLGRSGLSHLLLGSVAEKTVRHSPVPVLTVRSRIVRRRKPRQRGRLRRRRGGETSRPTHH